MGGRWGDDWAFYPIAMPYSLDNWQILCIWVGDGDLFTAGIEKHYQGKKKMSGRKEFIFGATSRSQELIKLHRKMPDWVVSFFLEE